MSRTFRVEKTWSVNRPPGTWRMCSCSSASSCGALAREKLRLLPSLSRMSMLAGKKLKALAGRQAQVQFDDVRRQAFQLSMREGRS